MQVLGSGTYGTVWSYGEDEAVKVIQHREFFSSSTLREIDVLSKIRSPYLVPCTRIEVSGTETRIYMKRARCDLLHLISHTTLAERQCWFLPLAHGLFYGLFHLHSCETLHRDLKPSNILLGPNDEIWLADFGLAKETHFCLTPDDVFTPGYRPPEIDDQNILYTERSDIFSAGRVLMVLFLNCYYRDEKKWTEALARLKRILPSSWYTLISWCVQTDPHRRPTAQEILKRCFGESPTLPRRSHHQIGSLSRSERFAQLVLDLKLYITPPEQVEEFSTEFGSLVTVNEKDQDEIHYHLGLLLKNYLLREELGSESEEIEDRLLVWAISDLALRIWNSNYFPTISYYNLLHTERPSLLHRVDLLVRAQCQIIRVLKGILNTESDDELSAPQITVRESTVSTSDVSPSPPPTKGDSDRSDDGTQAPPS